MDDITTMDKSGNLRLKPSKVAEWLMEQNSFITMQETEIILLYDMDSGSWKPNGERRIKNILQTELSTLLSNHTVNEIIEHVRRTEYLDPKMLNSKEGLINLKNGVYEVEKHELIPHSKDYYFTYTLPFNYDKTAEAKRFMVFLDDICLGNVEEMLTILEGFAYTFIPGYPIQKAMMLVGNGANGKGTLLNVLREFVGEDNCSHLTIQTVSQQTGFALARLQGRLLNIGPDLPLQGITDAGNFKAVTGGDTLDANVKYQQEAVRLRNSAKMWYSANQIPESPEDTSAYYRRWIILKFEHQYKEGKDILPELITERELQGIFNLVMEFYPVVKQNLKYTFSKDIETVRKDYLKSADSVQVFVEECMAFDPEAITMKSDVYKAYRDFCAKHVLIPQGSEDAFWRKIRTKITYTEQTLTRGGPRAIRGQRLTVPEPSKIIEKPIDSNTILENYLKLHPLQHLQHHISLLYSIIHTSSNFTTRRVNDAEGVADVSNVGVSAAPSQHLPKPQEPQKTTEFTFQGQCSYCGRAGTCHTDADGHIECVDCMNARKSQSEDRDE